MSTVYNTNAAIQQRNSVVMLQRWFRHICLQREAKQRCSHQLVLRELCRSQAVNTAEEQEREYSIVLLQSMFRSMAIQKHFSSDASRHAGCATIVLRRNLEIKNSCSGCDGRCDRYDERIAFRPVTRAQVLRSNAYKSGLRVLYFDGMEEDLTQMQENLTNATLPLMHPKIPTRVEAAILQTSLDVLSSYVRVAVTAANNSNRNFKHAKELNNKSKNNYNSSHNHNHNSNNNSSCRRSPSNERKKAMDRMETDVLDLEQWHKAIVLPAIPNTHLETFLSVVPARDMRRWHAWGALVDAFNTVLAYKRSVMSSGAVKIKLGVLQRAARCWTSRKLWQKLAAQLREQRIAKLRDEAARMIQARYHRRYIRRLYAITLILRFAHARASVVETQKRLSAHLSANMCRGDPVLLPRSAQRWLLAASERQAHLHKLVSAVQRFFWVGITRVALENCRRGMVLKKVQRAWRRYHTKVIVRRRKLSPLPPLLAAIERETEVQQAVQIIQHFYRRHVERKKMLLFLRVYNMLSVVRKLTPIIEALKVRRSIGKQWSKANSHRVRSACTIQRAFRCHCSRKTLQLRRKFSNSSAVVMSFIRSAALQRSMRRKKLDQLFAPFEPHSPSPSTLVLVGQCNHETSVNRRNVQPQIRKRSKRDSGRDDLSQQAPDNIKTNSRQQQQHELSPGMTQARVMLIVSLITVQSFIRFQTSGARMKAALLLCRCVTSFRSRLQLCMYKHKVGVLALHIQSYAAAATSKLLVAGMKLRIVLSCARALLSAKAVSRLELIRQMNEADETLKRLSRVGSATADGVLGNEAVWRMRLSRVERSTWALMFEEFMLATSVISHRERSTRSRMNTISGDNINASNISGDDHHGHPSSSTVVDEWLGNKSSHRGVAKGGVLVPGGGPDLSTTGKSTTELISTFIANRGVLAAIPAPQRLALASKHRLLALQKNNKQNQFLHQRNDHTRGGRLPSPPGTEFEVFGPGRGKAGSRQSTPLGRKHDQSTPLGRKHDQSTMVNLSSATMRLPPVRGEGNISGFSGTTKSGSAAMKQRFPYAVLPVVHGTTKALSVNSPVGHHSNLQ